MRRWLEDGRNVGSLVARTLKLLDLYGPTVLAAAVGQQHLADVLRALCYQQARPRRFCTRIKTGGLPSALEELRQRTRLNGRYNGSRIER